MPPFKRSEPLPAGWTSQAFRFALEPTPDQATLIRRHVGMRRMAYNWAAAEIKGQIERYHAGEALAGEKVSLPCLRKKWNRLKPTLCVDAETGEQWWPDLSKEAAGGGIGAAVGAYWDFVKSRNGTRKGPKMGFPKFRKKGRGSQSYSISTGTVRLDGRRHVRLPRLGSVRLAENAAKLDRLMARGRAEIRSASVSIEGDRMFVSLQCDVMRPDYQNKHRSGAGGGTVGVDVGLRVLAVVAAPDGEIIERVPNPKPLKEALGVLRKLNKKLARSQHDSNRRQELIREIRRAHAHVAAIRRDAMHKLTTRLAKTHSRIVIEDLSVAGMARQKGIPGARARRRGLYDAALGEFRRQLEYKTVWYGSELVVADRWFPSSQTCHHCGARQKIKWAVLWECRGCGRTHDRDDNAAVNLARYRTRTKAASGEGTQHSYGCGRPRSKHAAQTLSEHKTNPIPREHPRMAPSQARQNAPMREDNRPTTCVNSKASA